MNANDVQHRNPTTIVTMDPRTGKPVEPPPPYVHQPFPKHVYFKGKEGMENVIVKTEEDWDELRENTGHDWFASPGEALKGKHNPPPTPPEEVEDMREEFEKLKAENAKLKDVLRAKQSGNGARPANQQSGS